MPLENAKHAFQLLLLLVQLTVNLFELLLLPLHLLLKLLLRFDGHQEKKE